ncbi:MAG TPA: hypothetical protein VHX44_00260 [Planctomycetota bacterium]|nr:hypothetical protein [Planctomycetota bacterium]
MDPEFAALWQSFIDGELDDAQVLELERCLRADPALAALAGERYVEHRLLALALRSEPVGRFAEATLARVTAEGTDFSRKVQSRITSVATIPARPQAQRLTWSHYAFAASLAAMLALMVAWWSTPIPASPARPVATLVLADGCVWDGPLLAPGQRLMNGALHLRSGTALVRFDGGAEVLLSDVVDLTLESPGSAALQVGRVTVRASEGAAGFILRTPLSEVTDLGTEFALSVDHAGATDLQVIEGEVAWRGLRTTSADSGTVLRQGQGVRLRSANDATGEALTLTATTLASQVQRLSATDQGRLLSYDCFDYAMAHTVSRRQDAAGGGGWRAPWYRNHPTNELPLDFLPGKNLAMPDDLLPSTGGSLNLVTEITKPDTYRDAFMRLYVEPMDLSRDGVRYLSLLVQRAATWDGPKHHWFRCMLTSETVPSDRLGFGIMSNGCPHLLNHFGNTNGTVAIQDDKPYLCIFKVVSGRNTPDQAFLKLYAPTDSVDRHEPALWTLVGQPGNYNGVLGSIHINNGTDRAWTVDELRIGTSWESVTPRR